MSTNQLKRYREEAVDKLLSRTKELLKKNRDRKTIVFEAPTGSGKTFMMSQYIMQLINEMKGEGREISDGKRRVEWLEIAKIIKCVFGGLVFWYPSVLHAE